MVGPSIPRGLLTPHHEGVMLMITYAEMFQFCLVLIGIAGLFIQAHKKK